MTRLIDVLVPDIGDYKDVPVIELLVQPGDRVAADDPILTLESDKATMDVPAPAAGVVRELLAKLGDRVSQGSLLMKLEVAEGASPSAPAEASPAPAAAVAVPTPAPATPAVTTTAAAHAPTAPTNIPAALPLGGKVHASPSVRGYARALGVDLAQVRASGSKGRIIRDDVTAHVKAAMSSGSVPGKAAAAGAGLDLLPWPNRLLI